MKTFKSIAVALFLVTSVPTMALAAQTVKLDMRLELNGRLVSHPRVNLMIGKKGTIVQGVNAISSYAIEITPRWRGKDKVQLSFIVKQTLRGKTTLLSTPRVVTLIGQTAMLEQRNREMPRLRLVVTPTL